MDKVFAATRKAGDSLSPFQKMIDEMANMDSGGILGDFGKTISTFFSGAKLFESDASKTATSLKKVKSDLEAARLETEKFSKQLGVPINASAGIISAIDTLVDKASTADEKLRAVNDIINLMDGTSSTQDAVQKSNDSLRDFGASLQSIYETAAKEGLGLPDLFNKTTGEILTVSGAGSALRTEFKKVAEDGRNAAFKLAQAQADPQKAIEVLRTEMQKTRDKISEPLKLAGIPPEEIEKILAQLNLDPAKIEMLLNPESRDKAIADLKAAGVIAQDAVPTVTVPLDSDSAKFDTGVAEAEARGKGFSTNTFTPKLDADKSPFDGTLLGGIISGGQFAANIFKAKLDADKGGFDSITTSALIKGAEFGQKIWTAQVDATGNALTNVMSIWDTLSKINGNVFEASVNILGKVFGGSSADGSMHDGANWSKQFAPKFFANGGIENHTAQIAKPSSTLRVWAEPETGGEAYIPLASSKRARSTAILDEVAGKFGYQLVKNAQAFRNGGIVAGEGSGGGLSVHIDAAPGVAYQYAREVATEATTKLRDMQVLYDIH